MQIWTGLIVGYNIDFTETAIETISKLQLWQLQHAIAHQDLQITPRNYFLMMYKNSDALLYIFREPGETNQSKRALKSNSLMFSQQEIFLRQN